MTIDLTLREAQVLKGLLDNQISNLQSVNETNYPFRTEDTALSGKLEKLADPYWNS